MIFSPGEIWWTASDLGWIVGHEYICYSPLLNGNTSILYEGKPVGTPSKEVFVRDEPYLPEQGHLKVPSE